MCIYICSSSTDALLFWFWVSVYCDWRFPVCLAPSTGRASTPWTYGSSPRCTRRPVRIEWRCVHCCWVTAPIPHCSTATARARWMWRPHLSLKRGSPVSAIHPASAYFNIRCNHLIFCDFFFFLFFFFRPDEFKGHTLLQAAREADMAKVKKTAQEIISFKHPHSHDSALVSAGQGTISECWGFWWGVY